MKPFDIAILGAGSFGSAIAIHIARASHRVVLWGRNKEQLDKMILDNENSHYLPGVKFPKTLSIEHDLNTAVEHAKHVIIAVPSHAFSTLWASIKKPLTQISWLTKGIDPTSYDFLHTLVIEKHPTISFAVISGPSFAKEVAAGLPTALTLAHNNDSYAQEIHHYFHRKSFRVYYSNDFIGVQLAGAMKNVIAIAVGVSDGLGFGANARAALITRGLKEMQKLGSAFSAKEKTFMGLTGLGDLLLTATDNQSRNRRFGLALGEGISSVDAINKIGQVVEGRFNAEQICSLGKKKQIELPICHIVSQIIAEKITATEAVNFLLDRPATYE